MKKLIFILLFTITSCSMEKDVLITIGTPYGEMKAILFDETPEHKKNFVELTKSGKFNSTIFHRVMKDFMIQGGDVNAKEGANSITYTMPAEFNDKFFHSKGAIAAARMPDNVNPKQESSGCQFYIVDGRVFSKEELSTDFQKLYQGIQLLLLEEEYQEVKDQFLALQNNLVAYKELAFKYKDLVEEKYGIKSSIDIPSNRLESYSTIGGSPHLDGAYTVFGMVVEGMDVIDKIASVQTGPNNKPTEDVAMTISITMVKKNYITKNYGYQYPNLQ